MSSSSSCDTNFARVHQMERNTDLVDEDWVLDGLSDDDIDILADTQLKSDEDEDLDLSDGNPDVALEDIWEEAGLEKISLADFSAAGNTLLGTYLGHSTRPYPEPQTSMMREILTFSGPNGVSISGASLLTDP